MTRRRQLKQRRISQPPSRSPARLRAHYEVECELADRLRSANYEERGHLYPRLYEELFARVPDHPQVVRSGNPAQRRAEVEREMRLVSCFLPKGGTFLEIGAGDCAVVREAVRTAAHAWAIEVSGTISAGTELPGNVELLLTDGREIPVAADSVNVAYSNQVLEHLHPEDAKVHAENVLRALQPGGVYICATPNRLTGPHDISKHFDHEPTGFHLREYSTRDLSRLFGRAGFAEVRQVVRARSRVQVLSASPFELMERVLEASPPRLSRRLTHSWALKRLVGTVLARKAGELRA